MKLAVWFAIDGGVCLAMYHLLDMHGWQYAAALGFNILGFAQGRLSR